MAPGAPSPFPPILFDSGAWFWSLTSSLLVTLAFLFSSDLLPWFWQDYLYPCRPIPLPSSWHSTIVLAYQPYNPQSWSLLYFVLLFPSTTSPCQLVYNLGNTVFFHKSSPSSFRLLPFESQWMIIIYLTIFITWDQRFLILVDPIKQFSLNTSFFFLGWIACRRTIVPVCSPWWPSIRTCLVKITASTSSSCTGSWSTSQTKILNEVRPLWWELAID